MISFNEITHKEALYWFNNSSFYKHAHHKSFEYWIQHVFLFRKEFPELKKFIKSEPRWVASFSDEKIISIYYFSIVNKEMFDGFLISDPQYKKYLPGYKLGKYLLQYTENQWKINWSTCVEKYLKFNLKLGYKLVTHTTVDINKKEKVYLLRRNH